MVEFFDYGGDHVGVGCCVVVGELWIFVCFCGEFVVVDSGVVGCVVHDFGIDYSLVVVSGDVIDEGYALFVGWGVVEDVVVDDFFDW